MTAQKYIEGAAVAQIAIGYAAGKTGATTLERSGVRTAAADLIAACSRAPRERVLRVLYQMEQPEPTATPCIFNGSPLFTGENPCP